MIKHIDSIVPVLAMMQTQGRVPSHISPTIQHPQSVWTSQELLGEAA